MVRNSRFAVRGNIAKQQGTEASGCLDTSARSRADDRLLTQSGEYMRYPLSAHASLSVRLRRTCWVVLVRTNATATGIDVMLQIEKTFRDLARELHIAEPAALARRGLEDHRGVDNLAELAEVLAQGIDRRNRA